MFPVLCRLFLSYFLSGSARTRRFHVYQRQPVEEVIEEGESLKEGFAKELAEYLYFSDRAYDEPNDVKLQEKMEKRGGPESQMPLHLLTLLPQAHLTD